MGRFWAIAALVLAGVAGAEELPVPLRVLPGYVPGEDARVDERSIWAEMDEAEAHLRRSPMLVDDPVITDYVRGLACRVAGDYCPDLRIYVIRNPYFNASMAPNGVMIVHTGLLVRSLSSDHVAAVLGHELAHYTQAHSIKRLRAAKTRMTVGAIVSMGLAAGGISTGGLPEIFALTSVMGFTRGQESEADVLGAHFMAQAGLDARSAGDLWRLLEDEEARASVKRPKGPFFLSSHPRPEARAAKLDATSVDLVRATPSDEDGAVVDPFVEMLQHGYEIFMDEQIKQRDHGRVLALVERHAALGIRAEDVAFYRGEAWRIRGGAGDHEKAMAAYQEAISSQHPNARAFRELGYLELKHGDNARAREHLQQFLALRPDATDRALIEFYLEDGW